MSETPETIPPPDQPGDEPSQGVAEVERPAGRPLGVTILAILSLASAAIGVLGAAAVGLASQSPESGAMFAKLGVHPAVAVPSILLMAGANGAAGVLMLKGKRLGWGLYVGLLAYDALRNTHMIAMAGLFAEDMGLDADGGSLMMFKHSVRLVINVCLLIYMHAGGVRRYFGVERKRTSAWAIGLGVVAFGLLLAANFTAQDLSSL